MGTVAVSNAFATIEGLMTSGGNPIDTGVIVLAVDTSVTVGSNPPTINDALSNGSSYYYIGSSNSEGNYSIPVRGGITYKVHAWYTTFTGSTPNSDKKTGTATPTAGQTVTVNLSW